MRGKRREGKTGCDVNEERGQYDDDGDEEEKEKDSDAKGKGKGN